VQKHAQQRAVHPQLAVVLDETQLPELVQEVAHPRPRRTDHLRQRLLADLGRDRLRAAFLAEIRQQQEKPGEALFAGVEQLIDQVLFHPAVAREQVKHEPFGEPGLLLQDADHGRFLDPHDRAVCDRNGGCQSQRLPDQASLAEEVARSEDGDDSLFALLRRDQDLDLALLDVEHRIGGRALLKNDPIRLEGGNGSTAIERGEKHVWVEFCFRLPGHWNLSLEGCGPAVDPWTNVLR
jgi:hypothetical protein